VTPGWQRVAAANGAIAVGCLLAGFMLYSGRLTAIGDDAVNMNPASWTTPWGFLRSVYTGSGQMSSAVFILPWRMAVRALSIGPDRFAWWFPASLNMAFGICACYNVVLAGRRTRAFSGAAAAFMFVVAALCWIANPTVVRSSMVLPVTLLVTYTFPLYLTSLLVLLLSRIDAAPGWRVYCAAGIYVLVSLNTTTFMLSVPVLAAGILIARAIVGDLRWRACAVLVSGAALLSVTSALFIWSSPGFQQRFKVLQGGGGPRQTLAAVIPEWYLTSPERIYRTLDWPWSPIAHTVWVVALLGGLAWAAAALVARWRRGADAGPPPASIAVNLFALALLATFHASLGSLLFVGYFPDYTQTYPAFLLVLAFGATLVWLSRLVDGSATRLASLVVLGALVWSIGATNLEGSVNTYRGELRSAHTLRQLRKRIVGLAGSTPARAFRVTRCPVPAEPYVLYGISPGYFAWLGMADVKIMQDGAGDPAVDRKDAPAWTMVPCEVPPLLPWRLAPVHDFVPVRTVAYYTASDVGSWDTDFWVPPTTVTCRVTGSYNPSVKSSPHYRDSFVIDLIFGTAWNPASNMAMGRVVDVRPVGHLKALYDTPTVTVGFSIGDAPPTRNVPLEAFGAPAIADRPFLRVTISTLDGAGYLMATSAVRLTCG
jgi:hypothetical protein